MHPRLAEHGIWVVCADEMPNRQVLEGAPIQCGIPGWRLLAGPS